MFFITLAIPGLIALLLGGATPVAFAACYVIACFIWTIFLPGFFLVDHEDKWWAALLTVCFYIIYKSVALYFGVM